MQFHVHISSPYPQEADVGDTLLAPRRTTLTEGVKGIRRMAATFVELRPTSGSDDTHGP